MVYVATNKITGKQATVVEVPRVGFRVMDGDREVSCLMFNLEDAKKAAVLHTESLSDDDYDLLWVLGIVTILAILVGVSAWLA